MKVSMVKNSKIIGKGQTFTNLWGMWNIFSKMWGEIFFLLITLLCSFRTELTTEFGISTYLGGKHSIITQAASPVLFQNRCPPTIQLDLQMPP